MAPLAPPTAFAPPRPRGFGPCRPPSRPVTASPRPWRLPRGQAARAAASRAFFAVAGEGSGCRPAMSEASGSDDFSSSSSQSSGAGRLSLPSTSRNGAVPQHKQQRPSSRPAAPEEDGEEPEAAGESPRRLESAEVAGDERNRRMIRNQYRELIYSVQRKPGVRLPPGAARSGLWAAGLSPGPDAALPRPLCRGETWAARGCRGSPWECQAGNLPLVFEELFRFPWELRVPWPAESLGLELGGNLPPWKHLHAQG